MQAFLPDFLYSFNWQSDFYSLAMKKESDFNISVKSLRPPGSCNLSEDAVKKFLLVACFLSLFYGE